MSTASELLAELKPQVKANCAVADAAVAGRFSLCGLLLRLRNLYKWQRGIAPWQEQDTAPVLEWVSHQEELWEGLLEAEPAEISLGGERFDPFDTKGINALVAPHGLLYGAGRAGGQAPVFFLARQSRVERLNGLTVHHLGDEFSQDILFLPGLRQGGDIFLRAEPFPYLLWDLLADPRPSMAAFKRYALDAYGLDYNQVLTKPSWEGLAPVIEGEMKTVLWHELGEAGDAAGAAHLLAQAAGEHPGSDVEHFVRGMKDMLADCGPGGRLASIIEAKARGVLALYPVWLAGFLRLIFPEIIPTVKQFMQDEDWGLIEQAREAGWQKASSATAELEEILSGYKGAEARTLVRRVVMEPLVGCATPASQD
ncbi:MAG: hypothetical protein K9K66_01260 [Desulfarculaceae bacterium]|nr:hypothetical protein [Desulfarculaceae bacterium]MCF8072341.1 hypothetical protein [Desulfarculaceae bacterium]MCF8100262.1 hypothetical protein [Desulfarculaceae bacterium]MCF8116165.1 hypothetical protein [Desulfarculaceae bacterium]